MQSERVGAKAPDYLNHTDLDSVSYSNHIDPSRCLSYRNTIKKHGPSQDDTLLRMMDTSD